MQITLPSTEEASKFCELYFKISFFFNRIYYTSKLNKNQRGMWFLYVGSNAKPIVGLVFLEKKVPLLGILVRLLKRFVLERFFFQSEVLIVQNVKENKLRSYFIGLVCIEKRISLN